MTLTNKLTAALFVLLLSGVMGITAVKAEAKTNNGSVGQPSSIVKLADWDWNTLIVPNQGWNNWGRNDWNALIVPDRGWNN